MVGEGRGAQYSPVKSDTNGEGSACGCNSPSQPPVPPHSLGLEVQEALCCSDRSLKCEGAKQKRGKANGGQGCRAGQHRRHGTTPPGNEASTSCSIGQVLCMGVHWEGRLLSTPPPHPPLSTNQLRMV